MKKTLFGVVLLTSLIGLTGINDLTNFTTYGATNTVIGFDYFHCLIVNELFVLLYIHNVFDNYSSFFNSLIDIYDP